MPPIYYLTNFPVTHHLHHDLTSLLAQLRLQSSILNALVSSLTLLPLASLLWSPGKPHPWLESVNLLLLSLYPSHWTSLDRKTLRIHFKFLTTNLKGIPSTGLSYEDYYIGLQSCEVYWELLQASMWLIFNKYSVFLWRKYILQFGDGGTVYYYPLVNLIKKSV